MSQDPYENMTLEELKTEYERAVEETRRAAKRVKELGLRTGVPAQPLKVSAPPSAKRVLVKPFDFEAEKSLREAYCVGLSRNEHDEVVAMIWWGDYFAGLPFLKEVPASRILPLEEET